MTLPKPCPKPDCKAPIAHWHNLFGHPEACTFALRGKPCACGVRDIPCYDPREAPSPLHLPDVDAVARVIYEGDGCPGWDDERDSVKDEYRRNARDVFDLIAAHQPVWVEVPKGTLIVAGTRYRRACADGSSYERIAGFDFRSGNGAAFFIDLRTIPAPTLTERIRAALNDSPESTITLDVADVEALLDMAGGEDK